MLHADLAQGRWFDLSFAQQMANLGSEIHRLVLAKNRHQERFEPAFDRALELIDLTLADPRWKKRYKEVTRIREILCDICCGDNQYDTSLEALDDYFFRFGLLARMEM